jgi:hypothetical protein
MKIIGSSMYYTSAIFSSRSMYVCTQGHKYRRHTYIYTLDFIIILVKCPLNTRWASLWVLVNMVKKYLVP